MKLIAKMVECGNIFLCKSAVPKLFVTGAPLKKSKQLVAPLFKEKQFLSIPIIYPIIVYLNTKCNYYPYYKGANKRKSNNIETKK